MVPGPSPAAHESAVPPLPGSSVAIRSCLARHTCLPGHTQVFWAEMIQSVTKRERACLSHKKYDPDALKKRKGNLLAMDWGVLMPHADLETFRVLAVVHGVPFAF